MSTPPSRIGSPPRVEPPFGEAPIGTGAALARGDTALRFALGLSWLAVGWSPPDPATAWPGAATLGLRALLIGCGLLGLAGARPRTATAVGLLASLALLPRGAALAPWLALIGAAAARLVLRGGPASRWLDDARRRRADLVVDLLATEFGRAQATAAESPVERERALARAGDAYERAGRARSALGAAGFDTRATSRLARPLGRALALASGIAPALRDRLAAALLAAGARRAERAQAE